MGLKLKEKSALITGGSKGIGLATAKTFAAEGASLHLAARNTQDLQKTADAGRYMADTKRSSIQCTPLP